PNVPERDKKRSPLIFRALIPDPADAALPVLSTGRSKARRSQAAFQSPNRRPLGWTTLPTGLLDRSHNPAKSHRILESTGDALYVVSKKDSGVRRSRETVPRV